MNLEELLRGDLQRAPLPADLLPPADLAGTVLHGLRRQRRNRLLATAITVILALAVGIPLGLAQIRGDGAVEPAGPPVPDFDNPALVFPALGGGPQAIHTYRTDTPTERTFLLDADNGAYRELPYEYVVVSPDLATVAVAAWDGRAGVADRKALLSRGESVISWIPVPASAGLAWSPDGNALLVTSMVKDEATRTNTFTAHRYDLATGQVSNTPIDVDLLGWVGWAADSERYLALLRGEQGTDTVEPGALQYIDPDGTLGERIEIEGGTVGAAESYSPSRTYLALDSSGIMSAQTVPSKVMEVESGEIVTTLPGGRAMPVGWYDETTVVQVVRDTDGSGTLELVDITTGEVTVRIALTGLPFPTAMQIGSTEGFSGNAEGFGF